MVKSATKAVKAACEYRNCGGQGTVQAFHGHAVPTALCGFHADTVKDFGSFDRKPARLVTQADYAASCNFHYGETYMGGRCTCPSF